MIRIIMKNFIKYLFFITIVNHYLIITYLFATPSTTFWTPCTFDVQPYGVFHIGVDNYTTVGKKGLASGGEIFPVDYGVTTGVSPLEKIKVEAGIDLLEPSDDPLFFNVKVCISEDSIFRNSPAFCIGLFNVGTKKDVTDFDVFDFIIGKILPEDIGRLSVGYYIGSNTLKNSEGNIDNKGFMIGYDKYIYKDKIIFAFDYASGNNVLGGGGIGIYYFFTGNISLLVGPVWFNDKGINGDMKWTCQLDINL